MEKNYSQGQGTQQNNLLPFGKRFKFKLKDILQFLSNQVYPGKRI